MAIIQSRSRSFNSFQVRSTSVILGSHIPPRLIRLSLVCSTRPGFLPNRVPVTWALLRLARLKFAEIKLAPLKSAPLKSAPLKSAPLSLASLKSVSLKSAWLRLRRLRLTPLRLAPAKSLLISKPATSANFNKFLVLAARKPWSVFVISWLNS